MACSTALGSGDMPLFGVFCPIFSRFVILGAAAVKINLPPVLLCLIGAGRGNFTDSQQAKRWKVDVLHSFEPLDRGEERFRSPLLENPW